MEKNAFLADRDLLWTAGTAHILYLPITMCVNNHCVAGKSS